MGNSERDTIFALSSAAGPAGIAVVRISGPRAALALRILAGEVPQPRQARLLDLGKKELIDRGLVLWFPAPDSFSGEDVAELQVHGGRAVVAALLAALAEIPGLRPAGPGEFSRRAFENGKFDLTQAEAIADLVAAETEAQRRQAQIQLGGALGRRYEGWRGRLMKALAHFESAIDFVDEEIEVDLEEERRELGRVAEEIALHLAERRGERLRDGLSLAIVGPPNAGKSSLLNWLVRRDAAIVSATAGTTRDVIEVHLDLGGWPVVVADTAGLRRATGDGIEEEGLRRARERAEAADLRLVVVDAGHWPNVDAETASLLDERSVVLVNKVDLTEVSVRQTPGGAPAYAVSVKTGEGLSEVLAVLEDRLAGELAPEGASLTRARHRFALEESQEELGRALIAGAEVELAAENLRLASRALGRITGRVDVEDILDLVFAEFCIGK